MSSCNLFSFTDKCYIGQFKNASTFIPNPQIIGERFMVKDENLKINSTTGNINNTFRKCVSNCFNLDLEYNHPAKKTRLISLEGKNYLPRPSLAHLSMNGSEIQVISYIYFEADSATSFIACGPMEKGSYDFIKKCFKSSFQYK